MGVVVHEALNVFDIVPYYSHEPLSISVILPLLRYPCYFTFSRDSLPPSIGPCLTTAASTYTARNPYQIGQRSAELLQ